LIGEVTITNGSATLCESLRINLNAEPKTKSIAKKVAECGGTQTLADRARLIESSCILILRRHRQGEPPIRLTKDSPIEALSYALNPLVFDRKTTILYGDGGLGKSTLALLLAMLVSTGGTVAGISALPGRALYLDWEDSADAHTRRLRAIQAGHSDLSASSVLFRRSVEPLYKMVHSVVRQIKEEDITFVVVDSLLAATGGDSSAEGTAKLFAALRLMNASVLAIGHVPKTQPEGQERVTVYGSVFNQNFARSVWELKKEQEVDSDTAILGVFNRKSNLSRLHLPIGLEVTQNADNSLICYQPYDLSQAAELATSLPLPSRVRNLLEDGAFRSSQEIAEELTAPLANVKNCLSRHKGSKWHQVGENRESKWTVLNPKNNR